MINRSVPFEVAADALGDAALLLSPSGRILWVNQVAAALAGRSPQSLLSLTLMDILTPRSAEITEAALRSRLQGSLPALIELDIFRPNLSSCRLEVSFSLVAGVAPQY